MSTKLTPQHTHIKQQLHTGIEAARAGQIELAQTHLRAVLSQQPDNIPALLWLAFIAIEPSESVVLLEQVLELDPTNEKARSGLRWALARLSAQQTQAKTAQQGEPKTALESEAPSETDDADSDALRLRNELLSQDIQTKGFKSVLAHRARRNINPFLLFMVLLTGGAALFSLMNAPTVAPTSVVYNPPTSVVYNPPIKVDVQPVAYHQPAEVTPVEVEPISVPALAYPIETQRHQNLHLLEQADRPEQAQAFRISATSLFTQAGALALGQIVPTDQLAHQPFYEGQKWIEVDIAQQQLIAWEGNIPVMQFAMSSGLSETPTVLGKFFIYWKLKETDMFGADYHVEDVPFTMYFYEDYGIHGTYWHDNFGQQMSHGCVNLSIDHAQQLFGWADPPLPTGYDQVTASWHTPGTLVVVHE